MKVENIGKRVFGIIQVENNSGKFQVIGRVYETIAIGDILLACASEETDADCATFQVSQIKFYDKDVEQITEGYSALLLLKGDEEEILRKSKYFFVGNP